MIDTPKAVFERYVIDGEKMRVETPSASELAAPAGSVSEGQAWIVEYLCSLRPWLRKATWEDMCSKMRDHAPDIYALLSARGNTPNSDLSSGAKATL